MFFSKSIVEQPCLLVYRKETGRKEEGRERSGGKVRDCGLISCVRNKQSIAYHHTILFNRSFLPPISSFFVLFSSISIIGHPIRLPFPLFFLSSDRQHINDRPNRQRKRQQRREIVIYGAINERSDPFLTTLFPSLFWLCHFLPSFSIQCIHHLPFSNPKTIKPFPFRAPHPLICLAPVFFFSCFINHILLFVSCNDDFLFSIITGVALFHLCLQFCLM